MKARYPNRTRRQRILLKSANKNIYNSFSNLTPKSLGSASALLPSRPMAATELEELLGFLSSPSPNLKQAALEIVRGLTGSDEGIASLAAAPRALALQPLTSLLRDPTPGLASSAADSLVNLSQNPSIAEGLVSLGTILVAMDLVYKNGVDPGLASRLVMLLANLTQIDSGATALLQVIYL